MAKKNAERDKKKKTKREEKGRGGTFLVGSAWKQGGNKPKTPPKEGKNPSFFFP